MEKEDKRKVPEISIDEALQLYISMAFPQGLPEGEEGEQILKTIKAKIASERPEWAKASGWQSETEDPKGYSGIKQKAIEEAAEEDLPEDPEERYLYLRRQEARENSSQKRDEQREEQEKSNFRKELIENKTAEDEAILQRAALIKKTLLERARKKVMPEMGKPEMSPSKKQSAERPQIQTKEDAGIHHQQVDITKNVVRQKEKFQHQLDSPKNQLDEVDVHESARKPDAKAWFKDFKSLSVEDRMKSIKSYNDKKREMLDCKEDLMWNRKATQKVKDQLQFDDDNLSMDYGLSFGSDKYAKKGLRLE
ncbi:MAG: hypothetical protein ABJG47_14780 [Ekhidna sp.]